MKNIKLKEQERIVDEIRQYGLTLFFPYLLGMVFILCAAFFMFWFFNHDWWGQILFFVLLASGLFMVFRTYFLWRKNVFYITTHRVIDVEQRGFFHRVVSDISYEKIEDVTGNIKGVLKTLFRFGSLIIHTSQEKIKIVLPAVKRPLQLQQYINEMRDRYLQKYAHDFGGDVASSIIDKLYELELPELRRVQKALDKRLEKLIQHEK